MGRELSLKIVLACLFIVPSIFVSSPAMADLSIIIIEEESLPYNLKSSNYDNSPNNYNNSSSNYDNSVSNYENSPSNYDNSKNNYENGINGNRRLISENNKFVGYYVYSKSGVLNFYNTSGVRIGYIPATGKTQSIFADKEWCGTIGEQNGRIVLDITQKCFYRFMLSK